MPGWCRPPDDPDPRPTAQIPSRWAEQGSAARVLDPARHQARIAVMSLLISALITFVVVILVLYLVNMLPIDGRAKQIVRVIVIIIGILSLLKYLSFY
jgi:hypothetical protein